MAALQGDFALLQASGLNSGYLSPMSTVPAEVEFATLCCVVTGVTSPCELVKCLAQQFAEWSVVCLSEASLDEETHDYEG